MTTLIKIKRDSIRKNPNAGRDIYYVPMPWKTAFETNIRKDHLPDWLQERTTSWTISDNELCVTKGWLNVVDDKLMEYVQSVIKDGHKFEIKSKRNIHAIYSISPESDYIYEYADTKVKCSNCKKRFSVKDIEKEWDDDGSFEICPNCGDVNTFDYVYEKIEKIKK